jgi:sugar phosphate isomerase/epimerase
VSDETAMREAAVPTGQRHRAPWPVRIAASTTTTRDLPLIDALDAARDLGYDAVEVWAEHLWDQRMAPARLGAEARARGLALAIHGPTRDLNVTSSNTGIRVESQRQYLAALDDAAAMGAEVVVLHPGALSSSGDDPAAFWPPLEAFFHEVAVQAETLGLRVGIENMERRHLEFVTTPHLVADLLRRINSPWLGITLDVAHVLYNGDGLVLDGLEPHVYHVHLSGSTREKVHVPLDDGVHDLAAAVGRLLKFFRGIVAIEGYVRGRERETLARNRRAVARWLEAGAVG